MSDLAPLDAYCAALITRLAPAARRGLAREIAAGLRMSQAKRIAAQRNPDGSAYAPRKQVLRNKPRSIRRTMFAKLRTAKYLKVEASPNSAVVTFTGEVQRIARVHQFGLRDKVNRGRGPEVVYPVRELLGITPGEVAAIEETIIAHLGR